MVEHPGGGSPALYATDRGTYVVQGWRVPGREISVEIPRRLLGYLERNTRLATVLHETCVEVGKAWEGDADEAATR